MLRKDERDGVTITVADTFGRTNYDYRRVSRGRRGLKKEKFE